MVATLEEISGQAFDYVVVGGGTCGLTVAARLAEDANVTVAVLEAGSLHLTDPLIDVPGQLGRQIGNRDYDWCFKTAPQTHANNQSYHFARGKLLGGSSGINFFAWSKPPQVDVDAWERLGNPGWNWANYHKYSKKVESFTPPDPAIAAINRQVFVPESHGTTGPLKTSFPEVTMRGDIHLQEALQNVGIGVAKNAAGGDPIGFTTSMTTLHPETITRQYAMTAFYLPNKDKPNFKVLCETLALRLVTSGTDSGIAAEAVEFEHGGQVHQVYARKEVILSAGTLKTPQLLELSGVGNKKILEPLGIPVQVDLPGVGENVQEHCLTNVVYELQEDAAIETLDALSNVEYAVEQMKLHAERKGTYRLGVNAFTFVPLKLCTETGEQAEGMITALRKRIEAKSNSLPPGLKEQYDLQLEILESAASGDCEFVAFPQFYRAAGEPEPGKAYYSLMGMLNRPISRGTIHIKSTDPHEQAEIDPHYLEESFDLGVLQRGLEFLRRLSGVEPLKSILAREVAPGPKCTSDEDVKNYIKDTLSSTFHTAGASSMLPRDKNGVVDPHLKVYGTANVRVVDISIIPLHVSAHTQATAYAIAEQAADIIKGLDNK